MSKFSIPIELAAYKELDQFALLARQDYNLGGAGDWFGDFRGGLYGFYSRCHGVQRHYLEVHTWLPQIRSTCETEYHLATILFQLDSALECLTYSLNALGWIAMPSGFRDVTVASAIRQIGPLDVVGDTARTSPLLPLSGYSAVFPTVQREWQNARKMIQRICELHDVSKHRKTIFEGGRMCSDPPDGFYERHGVPDDRLLRVQLMPMEEIILKRDPKSPSAKRTPSTWSRPDLLEEIVPSFAKLIEVSGAAALQDARVNIALNENQLRKPTP